MHTLKIKDLVDKHILKEVAGYSVRSTRYDILWSDDERGDRHTKNNLGV